MFWKRWEIFKIKTVLAAWIQTVKCQKEASSGELAQDLLLHRPVGMRFSPQLPCPSTESGCMHLQPQHGGEACNWQERLTLGTPGQPVQMKLWALCLGSNVGSKKQGEERLRKPLTAYLWPRNMHEEVGIYVVTHAVTHNKAEQDFTEEAQHCPGEFGHWHAKADMPVRATLMFGTSSGSLSVLFI